MTFPVYESVGRYYAASGNAHPIVMPSGVVAGDLLIAIVGNDFTTITMMAELGWRLDIAGSSNGVQDSIRVFSKLASGSEGADEDCRVVLTEALGAHVYRISGGAEKIECSKLEATTAFLTVTMPSLTPSWGADDVLWIEAVVAMGMTGITSMSSGYSAGIYDGAAPAAGVALISAHRTENTATESPGTIVTTGGSNAAYVAVLIAVRTPPASGGGSVIVIEEE